SGTTRALEDWSGIRPLPNSNPPRGVKTGQHQAVSQGGLVFSMANSPKTEVFLLWVVKKLGGDTNASLVCCGLDRVFVRRRSISGPCGRPQLFDSRQWAMSRMFCELSCGAAGVLHREL